VLPIHFCRDCIYKEIKTLKKSKKVTPEELHSIKRFLKKRHFPTRYGLNENNVIYRKHNNAKVISMMEDWWAMICDIVPRDQLCLSYVLWKNNILPYDIAIPNIRFQIEHFHLYFSDKHK